ncbi:MAG TPA: beta-eliminating lyase-related protein [Micromonosporaceae bacterium]
MLSGTRPLSIRERLAGLASWDRAGGDLASGGLAGEDLVLEGPTGAGLDGPGDRYGNDSVVATLEERVAALLGKPAAVFFPTGTMAQQVALRCWAQVSGSPVVAMHPLGHLEVHERHAYATLSGLRAVWPTQERRPPTAAEVRDLDEPFGTLLLELPLRDAGYLLPTWDELVSVVGAARERGARVHFDGARLWESTVYLGQDLPTIAALADSVYVSFYKSLDGMAGAAVAGSAEFVGQARAWRHRYGGNVFQQWPAALSALTGLTTVLPHLPSYVAHAGEVAGALAQLPGAIVYPNPPHTHQFQLWLPYPAEALNEAGLVMAEQDKVWFAGRFVDQPPTGLAMTEVTVADPALTWSAEDIVAAGEMFLDRVSALS